MLSNLAHHLSANYLWMMFCRLSSVGSSFCCSTVSYLVDLNVFWEIQRNEISPEDFRFFVWALICFDLLLDFDAILAQCWLDVAQCLHHFLIGNASKNILFNRSAHSAGLGSEM